VNLLRRPGGRFRRFANRGDVTCDASARADDGVCEAIGSFTGVFKVWCRMTRASLRPALITAASIILSVLASASSAQEIGLSILRAWPDHELLGRPTGGSVSFAVVPIERVAIRISYERYQTEFESFGTTCSGLIPPGLDCSDEVRSEDAQMRAWVLSIPAALVTVDRLQLRVVPGYRTVRMVSSHTGARSGRTRSASKRMSGFQFGAEVGFRIVRRWPLRLHLSAHRSWLNQYDPNIVIDGYNAFERDVALDWLEIGATVAWPW
jgi:hypothetical protein